VRKATRHYGRINFAAIVGAVAANIALKPLTNGKIFDWPKAARFAIRTSLFAAPLGYTVFYSWKYYFRLNLYLEEKYGDRIARFMKTGDPKAVNPDFVDPYGDFHP
jgi:hypothetical protein